MSTDIIDRKEKQLKDLQDKHDCIPEAKYKQRALVKSKISAIKLEIEEIKRTADKSAGRQKIISELELVYATGKMTLINKPQWNKFTDAELEHHLKRCKEKLSAKGQ